MCGRFALYEPEKIILRFAVETEFTGDWTPGYNLSPGQYISIIIERQKMMVTQSLWGLHPPWNKQDGSFLPLVNVRSESLINKRGMQPMLEQRCLIPANGFYEWVSEEKFKQPYYLFHPEKDLLAFAGLYQLIKDEMGNILSRCAIITTQAKNGIEKYHHRMPLIIPPGKEKSWLHPLNPSEQQLKSLAQEPDTKLEVYPVSHRVNSPRNNSPDLIRPLE